MKTGRIAWTVLGGALLLAMLGAANEAQAAYDLQVKFLAPVNLPQGQAAVGKRMTFRVELKNSGPDKLPAGYKVGLSKFDHTGQQFIKEIGTARDLPQLTSGQTQTFVWTEDNPPAGSFFYKPGITGTPLFTDSNNANHKPDTFVKYVAMADMVLHAGVASGVASPDNKHRFTASISGAYQDATTSKRFRFHARRDNQNVAEWETTTNGTNATWIKDPQFGAGTYQIVVTAWIKQGDTTLQTITRNITGYVVP